MTTARVSCLESYGQWGFGGFVSATASPSAGWSHVSRVSRANWHL